MTDSTNHTKSSGAFVAWTASTTMGSGYGASRVWSGRTRGRNTAADEKKHAARVAEAAEAEARAEAAEAEARAFGARKPKGR